MSVIDLSTSKPISDFSKVSSRSCVIYFANQQSDLLTPFARHLRQNYGIQSILSCRSKSALPKDGRSGFHADEFAAIVEHGDLLELDKSSSLESPGVLAEEVDRIERQYRIHLIDIIRTDRHFGIGFVAGSKFLRSARAPMVNFGQSLTIALRLVCHFEELLRHINPCVVITGFGPMAGASLFSVAESLGVPVRTLCAARLGKGLYWAVDRYLTPHNFEQKYRRKLEINKNLDEVQPVHLEQRPAYASQKIHQQAMKRTSLRFLVRACFSIVKSAAISRIRGRHLDYGQYSMSSRLKQMYSQWRWRRAAQLENPLMRTLSDQVSFILYPLMVEPESSIMSEAQAADNQLAIIDWLCKAVPAGWYVMVKEHPGRTSPRPNGFWERIKSYPNVLVAATFEDIAPILQRAQAVATINGTVGLQAAISGMPVITFHRGFIGRNMKHVYLAESYTETQQALERLKRDDTGSISARRLSGKAFNEALDDMNFRVQHEGLLIGVPTSKPVSSIDAAMVADQLIKTLYQRGNTGLAQ